MGSTDKKSLKSAAHEAKQRLSSGFWQDFKNDLEGEVQKAVEQGKNASKVVKYYTEKVGKDVKGGESDETFFLKVKKILDDDGEVGDVLGRLTDKEYFQSLNYDQRQRYTLELSEKYRVALIRYKKEKEFENYNEF